MEPIFRIEILLIITKVRPSSRTFNYAIVKLRVQKTVCNLAEALRDTFSRMTRSVHKGGWKETSG